MRLAVGASAALTLLAGCYSEEKATSLGQVDPTSFEAKTGETWPLTIAGGELFCQFKEVSLGENYLLFINVDGQDYALNPTAYFLLDDGNAQNWEAIWRKRPDSDRHYSLDGFDQYLTDECKGA